MSPVRRRPEQLRDLHERVRVLGVERAPRAPAAGLISGGQLVPAERVGAVSTAYSISPPSVVLAQRARGRAATRRVSQPGSSPRVTRMSTAGSASSPWSRPGCRSAISVAARLVPSSRRPSRRPGTCRCPTRTRRHRARAGTPATSGRRCACRGRSRGARAGRSARATGEWPWSEQMTMQRVVVGALLLELRRGRARPRRSTDLVAQRIAPGALGVDVVALPVDAGEDDEARPRSRGRAPARVARAASLSALV